jgi:flagellar basal body-associated protein FliL
LISSAVYAMRKHRDPAATSDAGLLVDVGDDLHADERPRNSNVKRVLTVVSAIAVVAAVAGVAVFAVSSAGGSSSDTAEATARAETKPVPVSVTSSLPVMQHILTTRSIVVRVFKFQF